MTVDSSEEFQLRTEGFIHIAGVDEVGRGALAGPVVSAIVIFPTIINIDGINDSKKLSEKKRNQLFIEIKKKASAIGIGIINHKDIDTYNILQATFMSMKKAINDLPYQPDFILVDGNKPIPNIDIQQKTIIAGDSKSISIAAASIIAKVTRDNIMIDLHKKYPTYQFNKNKGYGTKEHQNAIFKDNISDVHRKTFNTSKQLHLF
jgi:ribonuclease HII